MQKKVEISCFSPRFVSLKSTNASMDKPTLLSCTKVSPHWVSGGDKEKKEKADAKPKAAESKPAAPPPPEGEMSEAEMLAMLKGFGSQVDYTADEEGATPAPPKPPPKPKKTRKVKKMVKQKVKKTVKKMVKVKKGEKPPAKKPSASSTALVPKHKAGGNPFTVDTEESTGITFEQCVREVVLGKSLMDESGKDKLNRLGRLVSSRDQG